MSATDKHIRTRYLSGGNLARSKVMLARRRGALRDPTDFNCMDCGAPATVYDHRDYNHPLDVDPVCRKCNAKRGPARPKKWADGELQEYARKMKKRTAHNLCGFHTAFFEMAGI